MRRTGAQSARCSEADNGTEDSYVTSVRRASEPMDDDLISIQGEETATADQVPDVAADNFLDIHKDNSRISSLKPDAPEFIPQCLEHLKTASSRAVNEHNAVIESTRDGDRTNYTGKENCGGEATIHAGYYHGLDRNAQIPQTSRRVSKRNDIEGNSSTARDRVGTVLSLRQVVNSNAVNANVSPNKTHKHKKKRVSRRRLSKSEPPSFEQERSGIN